MIVFTAIKVRPLGVDTKQLIQTQKGILICSLQTNLVSSIVKIAGVAVACALGGGAGPVMAEVLVSESNAVSVNAVSAVDLNLTMTVDTTAIIGGSVGTQASIFEASL